MYRLTSAGRHRLAPWLASAPTVKARPKIGPKAGPFAGQKNSPLRQKNFSFLVEPAGKADVD
jgi:hypothetical protein